MTEAAEQVTRYRRPRTDSEMAAGAFLGYISYPARPRLPHCSMQIRPAKIGDAAEACEMLRGSITELCQADHQNDSRNLEAWLSNKTADNVRSWITNPNTYVIIATEGATIIGVGAVTSSGEIILNYVSPFARFRAHPRSLDS